MYEWKEEVLEAKIKDEVVVAVRVAFGADAILSRLCLK